MRCRSLIAALAGPLAALSCGGSTPAAPGAPVPFSVYSSAHFEFHYTEMDAGRITETAAALEAQYAPFLDDLRVASMPRVLVFLHPDRGSLRDAVRPVVGELPEFASGLVTGPDRIHILSPMLASAWSYERALSALAHEFAHCVTLSLEPHAANNPRWLWESVALYEARQFVHPRTLPYLVGGGLPPLAALDAISDTRIYDLGYVLGEFIVESWGREGLVALVRAHGDTTLAVGLGRAEFEERWGAFVRARYLS